MSAWSSQSGANSDVVPPPTAGPGHLRPLPSPDQAEGVSCCFSSCQSPFPEWHQDMLGSIWPQRQNLCSVLVTEGASSLLGTTWLCVQGRASSNVKAIGRAEQSARG